MSHNLVLLDFSVHKGNMIIIFDPCAHRFSIISAAVIKLGEDLGWMHCTHDLPTRTLLEPSTLIPALLEFRQRLYQLSTLFRPYASPSKRIWSRLWHAVTKSFSKRRDVAGVKDLGQPRTRFLCYSQDVLPLFITEASSVRDRDVTRPNGRPTKPAHPASASVSIVLASKYGVSSAQKHLSKRLRLSNRADIDFTTNFRLRLYC
jgi:hypothetical protein